MSIPESGSVTCWGQARNQAFQPKLAHSTTYGAFEEEFSHILSLDSIREITFDFNAGSPLILPLYNRLTPPVSPCFLSPA
jgi:hypothetical protein